MFGIISQINHMTAWANATQSVIEKYRFNIDRMLGDINCLLQCCNSKCISTAHASVLIDDYYHVM